MYAGIDQRGRDLRCRQLPQACTGARLEDVEQLLLDGVALGIAALVVVMVGVDDVVQCVRAHIGLDVGADPGAQSRHAIVGRLLLNGMVDLGHELQRVALRQRLQDLGARGEVL